MGESRTNEELVDLIRQGVTFSGGSALHGEEGIETMALLLTETAHPDFVTVMVGGAGNSTEYAGVDGFRQALGDWITPYERFSLEIDEVVVNDDKLVFLVRQVGTTKHDEVEIETPSGSVFELEDGQIRRATFYIDPREARAAGGLD